MTASRTSNKQILEAIEGLTQAITGMVTAQAAAIPTLPVEAKEQPTQVKLDKAYLEHVCNNKAKAYADKTGEGVVVYSRRNGRGEVKLAYCVASKYADLKDRNLIGAVATVDPS